jgi:hypothetical protein
MSTNKKKMGECGVFRCFKPSLVSMVIPVFCFSGFLFLRWAWDLKALAWILLFIVTFLPLWLFFSYLLFPRIVVTIEDKNLEGEKEIILLADGKEIKKDILEGSLPVQFSFQVWRKGTYDLCLKMKSKSKVQVANTFEHMVCNIRFENKQNRENA